MSSVFAPALNVMRREGVAIGDEQRKGNHREHSSFLKYQNDQGLYADFHSFRKTFITNLSRARVSPKTAQILARHCDINLTNTHTMLGVLGQAAAVEALPPIPLANATTEPITALTLGKRIRRNV